MQGMTKKLVSSRNLRTVSAIPVPKTSLLSSSVHSKTTTHLSSALHRSSTTRSPRRHPSAISATASRSVTQPPTSQDKDPDTGLPRPRSTRPPSRLSISSDHQQQTGIPMLVSSETTAAGGIPRRKASIDMTEKFSRPLSLHDLYKSHLRRQSAGMNASSKDDPSALKPPTSSSVLGKSISSSIRAGALHFKR